MPFLSASRLLYHCRCHWAHSCFLVPLDDVHGSTSHGQLHHIAPATSNRVIRARDVIDGSIASSSITLSSLALEAEQLSCRASFVVLAVAVALVLVLAVVSAVVMVLKV
jgi:hypothetical protein